MKARNSQSKVYGLHVLCSETTDGDKFDLVLELIAGMGRVIFKLFQHPSLAIVKAAGLIMKSIIEVRGWLC